MKKSLKMNNAMERNFKSTHAMISVLQSINLLNSDLTLLSKNKSTMKSNDNQNSSLIMLFGTKYAIWFSTTKSYKSLNLLTVTSCKVLKKQPFPLRLNSTFISLHLIHKAFSLNLRNVYARKIISQDQGLVLNTQVGKR